MFWEIGIVYIEIAQVDIFPKVSRSFDIINSRMMIEKFPVLGALLKNPIS